MSQTQNGTQSQVFNTKPTETTDKDLWDKFQLRLSSRAKKFPDNKIYATINVDPDSARQLINSFEVLVNGNICEEVSETTRDITVVGFDVRKTKETKIEIKAIPCDKRLNKTEKRSEPRTFHFTGEIFRLSPTVKFVWDENVTRPTTVITWYRLGDKKVHEYVVCLDKKEIVFIKRQDIRLEMCVCIHGLEVNREYSVQIKAKLKNGKETCRSKIQTVTVPNEKPTDNEVVISVVEELFPLELLAVLDTTIEAEAKTSSTTETRFRERALELLKLMEKQMDERKRLPMQYPVKTNRARTSRSVADRNENRISSQHSCFSKNNLFRTDIHFSFDYKKAN